MRNTTVKNDNSTVRLNALAMLIFPFIWWPFVDPWTSDAANDNAETAERFGLRTGAASTETTVGSNEKGKGHGA